MTENRIPRRWTERRRYPAGHPSGRGGQFAPRTGNLTDGGIVSKMTDAVASSLPGRVVKTAATAGRAAGKRVGEALKAADAKTPKGAGKAVRAGIAAKEVTGAALKAAIDLYKSEFSILDGIEPGLGKKIKEFIDSDDLKVNTGGFLGSIAGGAAAGRMGALAGDLAGALAVRTALVATKSVVEGRAKARLDSAYEAAGFFERLKRDIDGTLGSLRENQEAIKDDYYDDVLGWATGNSAANYLDSVISVPLKGAAVAAPTVVGIKRFRQRLRGKDAQRRQT